MLPEIADVDVIGRASSLIAEAQKAESAKAEYVKWLRAQREAIDKALKALGEPINRKAGRPTGSRNRKQAEAPSASV